MSQNILEKFPTIDERVRQNMLEPPRNKPVRAVLDTDTYNEVDDQFALAYSILAPEHITLEAVYAAPFKNNRAASPGEGMEKSFEEILRILDFLGVEAEGKAFKGSKDYLASWEEPRESDAVSDLIERARTASPEAPLYVMAIGAITNVASAFLLAPDIIRNVVLIWLGGKDIFHDDAFEFNLKQDWHASRLVFDCGVPLVIYPTMNVTSHLLTTVAELRCWLGGHNALCDYLVDIVSEYVGDADPVAWSKVIWDIAAPSWLIDANWTVSQLDHAPILNRDFTWAKERHSHKICMARYIRRDSVFRDLFYRLRSFSK